MNISVSRKQDSIFREDSEPALQELSRKLLRSVGDCGEVLGGGKSMSLVVKDAGAERAMVRRVQCRGLRNRVRGKSGQHGRKDNWSPQQ